MIFKSSKKLIENYEECETFTNKYTENIGGKSEWVSDNGTFFGEPEDAPKSKSETKVKEIELLTDLDDGSANDSTGGLQKGIVFGKTYKFKVKSYTKEEPTSKSVVKWMYKYHNLKDNKWEEVYSKNTGENYAVHFNEEEMCGRFIYIRAYIDDEKEEGELKVWKHNRFRWFDRKIIKNEVNERETKPYLADQNETPTCGMAAIYYLLAKKEFEKYKKFVLELHQTGVSKCNSYSFDVSDKSLHLLKMNPNTNTKYPNYKVKMPYCDWISFSCMRDKENGVRNYDGENDESFDGSTLPRELVKVTKEILGFTSVVDNTNVVFNKGTLFWDGENSSSREIAKMEELYSKGYSIVMFINTKMLEQRKETIDGKVVIKTGVKSGLLSTFEHWVVFEGVIGGTINWDEFDFKVFTWGEIRNVTINPEAFGSNFYGYVYGK